MSKAIRIRKGLNIRLKGEAEKVLATAEMPDTIAIKPTDFVALAPKLKVKEGDKLMAGDLLFTSKENELIRFTSPVSGEVAAVVRGEKRKILEIRILADREVRYKNFGSADPSTLSREQIKAKLLEAGVWPFIRQRPFSTVADPGANPKAIFISAFDSAPLAPDYDYVLHNHKEEFQKGIDALVKLTDGKVNLTLKAGNARDDAFRTAKGVEVNTISGPHPAGNVGVQIHHISPINKGEVVWYVNPQDVALIGRFFLTGQFDTTRVVTLSGSEVTAPKYYKLPVGANISKVVKGAVKDGKLRYISGNPLTGDQIAEDGYLGYYHHQISVLPEITDDEFFLTKGWMSPGFGKFSASQTYPSWLLGGKKYRLHTGSNGEERAFVVTGQYEKVFPFSILPVYLLKAIITKDIEKMENLGIYEVDSEDFALCEFVCTSKINSQQIVREGLEIVRKECM
jgi:Na+-transporting NADH:ubiquinone oxidoreductase subunit A